MFNLKEEHSLHLILPNGECHVHPVFCAFTVFNGNNFGNLDTL